MPKTTSRDGVRINYAVDGSGSPLVLIPGALNTIPDLANYADALRDERTVIRVDPRGRGGSDTPEEASRYTWRQNAADVVAIIDALGHEKVDVFGYSQGGAVVLALLSGHGDRLRSAVAGGVPVPPPGYNEPDQSELDRAAEMRKSGMHGLMAWLDSFEPSVRGDKEGTAWLQGVRARTLKGNIQAFIAECEGHSSIDGLHLPDDGPPTLLLAGSEDTLPAALGPPTAARLSYVSYREIPGREHVQCTLDVVLPLLKEFWTGIV